MAWGAQKTGISDLIKRLRDNDARTTSLCILSGRKVGPNDVLDLAEALVTNTRLEELLASGHPVSPEGAAALGKALTQNRTLRTLAVGDSSFGDAGVAAFVKGGLGENAGLHVLDLEFKGIASCNALGELLALHSSLQVLKLGRNLLDDAALTDLAAGLRQSKCLTALHASDNKFSGQGIVSLGEALASSRVSVLDLNGNTLDDGAAASMLHHLSPVHSLQSLLLSRCSLGLASAEALAQLIASPGCHLKQLDISTNDFSGPGIECIARALGANASIRDLSMGANKLGDTGAAALGDSLSKRQLLLDCLDVSGNEMTLDGVRCVIQGGHTLELSLFNNKVEDAGAPALADALMGNSCLQAINIGACCLTGPGVAAVLACLEEAEHPSLQRLEVGGNTIDGQVEAAIRSLRERRPHLRVIFRAAAGENAGNPPS
eukprot:jgi/Mesvir1/17438/Mv08716-RA.1